MEIHAFTMKLFPGMADEYKRRHDNIWPELIDLLEESGISSYSISLDEERNMLFARMTVKDFNLLQQLAHHPLMHKWWAYMQDIMETAPDGSPLSETLRPMFFMPGAEGPDSAAQE